VIYKNKNYLGGGSHSFAVCNLFYLFKMFYLLIFNFEFLIINYYLGGGSLPLAPSLPTAGIPLPPPGCARGTALYSITTAWQGTPANLVDYEKIIRIFL
jgi:hypothetical protein